MSSFRAGQVLVCGLRRGGGPLVRPAKGGIHRVAREKNANRQVGNKIGTEIKTAPSCPKRLLAIHQLRDFIIELNLSWSFEP